jgi:hypothetical protein
MEVKKKMGKYSKTAKTYRRNCRNTDGSDDDRCYVNRKK